MSERGNHAPNAEDAGGFQTTHWSLVLRAAHRVDRDADAALAALRSHRLGADAVLIGDIREEPQGIVVLRTSFGGTRIVDMLVGDPLPRIC